MNILKKSGNLTMAEMYRLTKSPDIAKMSSVKGQTLDIARFIVHEDTDQDGNSHTIVAIETEQGECFATNSATFTRDFMDIVSMCEEAGEPLPTKVTVKAQTGKSGREYIQCVYVA